MSAQIGTNNDIYNFPDQFLYFFSLLGFSALMPLPYILCVKYTASITDWEMHNILEGSDLPQKELILVDVIKLVPCIGALQGSCRIPKHLY